LIGSSSPPRLDVSLKAPGEIKVWGIVTRPVVRCERPLRGDEVVEVPRRKAAGSHQGLDVHLDVRAGNHPLEVGQWPADLPTDPPPHTLERKESYRLPLLLDDGHHHVAPDGRNVLREFRAEVRARKRRLPLLKLRPGG